MESNGGGVGGGFWLSCFSESKLHILEAVSNAVASGDGQDGGVWAGLRKRLPADEHGSELSVHTVHGKAVR